ncbi:MAG: copper amine oxidase N-terminal domain-containing protein [Syntrophomonadaceae bacterium]|nr:copper amine oxidase N-terminal domain-containing protein [Syntrophomonadaceae bacterium]
MKGKWRKSLVLLTTVCSLLFLTLPSGSTAAMASSSFIQVKINGEELKTDISPAIVDGRVIVPMRAIFEALGADLVWDPDMGMVSAVKGETKVTIKINSRQAWVNMNEVIIDVAPQVVDMRTMVPLRFISESLGEKVEWDAANRIVYIGNKNLPALPQPADTNYTKEYTLKSNTSLAYRQGKTALFKAGTVVKMRNRDFVKSGVLVDNTFLPCSEGRSEALFKGTAQISFNDNGYVQEGTLAGGFFLEYAPIDTVNLDIINRSERNKVFLKDDTMVKFNSAGYVSEGTLDEDTSLQYSSDSLATFKANTRIFFRENGKVRQGTLKEAIYILYLTGKTISFKEGSNITFYDNGQVETGFIGQDTSLYVNSQVGTIVELKKEKKISFYNDGYLCIGILKTDSRLPYQTGSIANFKSDKLIKFYDNGYVNTGTLANTTSLPCEGGSYHTIPAGTTVNFNSNGHVTGR